MENIINDYYAVEVQDRARDFCLFKALLTYCYGSLNIDTFIRLPSGKWQVVGRADELTEEQMEQICPMKHYVKHFPLIDCKLYGCHDDSDVVCANARDSFRSLLNYKSLNPSTTVILRKIQDTPTLESNLVAPCKISDDILFPFVEKMVFTQMSDDPMGEVVAKMALLREFINENVKVNSEAVYWKTEMVELCKRVFAYAHMNNAAGYNGEDERGRERAPEEGSIYAIAKSFLQATAAQRLNDETQITHRPLDISIHIPQK